MRIHNATISRSIAIGLLGLASATLGGCVALAVGAAAGVGTYAYIKGELTDFEEASLDRAYEATQAAIKDLEFTVKDQAKDSLQARIVASEADKTEVKIVLESKGEKLTKFSIRVGVFGDEARARLIMDKIKKHL